MKNIYFKAWLFRLKLRGNLSYEQIKMYAEKLGFFVVNASSDEGKEELKEHDISCSKKGCTYISGQIKLIILNDENADEMRLLLLHELAHIILGHTSDRLISSVQAEIEADAFVYHVQNISWLRVICLIAAICITIGIHINYSDNKIVSAGAVTSDVVSVSTASAAPTEIPTATTDHVADFVFVTPSGKKYHTFDCRYIHEATAVKISVSEAVKMYSPCTVCKPNE